MSKPKLSSDYIRSAFFGCEDSLVSTAGVIAGISTGTHQRSIILLAGLVAVSVEAVSMGAGELLSVETRDKLKGTKKSQVNPGISAGIMFVSYALAGMIPLAPLIFLRGENAFVGCVIASLIGLFALGVARGKVTHTPLLRNALRVLIIGGLAAGIGVAVGLSLRV